jgi:hypothetical protein
MRQKVFYKLFLLALIFFSMNSQAQDRKIKLENPFENKGDLNSQFDYLLKTSTSYNNYKIVLKDTYLRIQKNVQDSVFNYKNQSVLLKNEVKQLETSNAQLQERAARLQKELDVTKAEKDSITIMGMPLQKNLYNLILIASLLILFSATLFFIYKYRNSNRLTLAADKSLSETQLEFSSFQKNALKRQQELNRKLQDEILKKKV